MEIGVNPPAVTTPFLIMFWVCPVEVPTLKLEVASRIGAPKSTPPVANAWV